MTQPYTKPKSAGGTIKCFVAYILLVATIIGIRLAIMYDESNLLIATRQQHLMKQLYFKHFEIIHSNLLWATVGFLFALIVMFMKVKK